MWKKKTKDYKAIFNVVASDNKYAVQAVRV